MYLYIVDTFAQDKKFQRELLHIQARVQDLGINGRFEKLTMLKSIQDIVHDAERKGVETIVAIGNDKTFNSVVAHLTKNTITLGLIPLGEEDNSIAHALHIPEGEAACTVLSKRIIKKMDLGKVNGKFFFSSLSIPASHSVQVEIDKSYRITTTEPTPITIVNFCNDGYTGNAEDGKLEAIVEESESDGFVSFFRSKKAHARTSVIPTKSISVKSKTESVPIYSEGNVMVKTPATIEVASKKLRIITGT